MTTNLTDRFSVFDNSATSPVILHAPHGSRFIPDELLPSYRVSSAELDRERDAMTDHATDVWVESVANTTGACALINRLSRFIVDVERFPDEREEMRAVGMGAFYTRGSTGQEIRAEEATRDPRLREFFDSYSLAFTELVQRAVDAHGQATIIDVHTFPQHALPYELHAHEPRPQVDIGADATHTPLELIESVRRAFAPLECGINESFHGTYVPLRFYDAHDTRVSSVMLEIRRDTYMSESTQAIDATGSQSIVRAIESLVRELNVAPRD